MCKPKRKLFQLLLSCFLGSGNLIFRLRALRNWVSWNKNEKNIKTKVISLANHKGGRQFSEPIKIQNKYNRCSRHEARENACERLTMDFVCCDFTSDWREWREFFGRLKLLAMCVTFVYSSTQIPSNISLNKQILPQQV